MVTRTFRATQFVPPSPPPTLQIHKSVYTFKSILELFGEIPEKILLGCDVEFNECTKHFNKNFYYVKISLPI